MLLKEYASFVHPSNAEYRRTIKASVYGDSQEAVPDPLIDRTVNTYDGFNRLTKVEKVDAGVRMVAEYVYNGDDLRVRKTVRKSDSGYTPEVTSFLYDRQHVILETDGSGNISVRYIRGVNYIAQYSGGSDGSSGEDGTSGTGSSGGGGASGGSLTWFLYNGHGDTVQTVTTAGEIQNQYDYDVFGNPTLTIETAACSIRYAGEYLDNETGMYYLRARYYDPNIGRFISEDSYWGEDVNPLSLNLYTYAFNNPIRFIDPSGHMTEEDAMFAQITRMAQIDKLKELWAGEEADEGKDQSEPTAVQTWAHNAAEKIREEIIEMEKERLNNLSEYGPLEEYKTNEINMMISLVQSDREGKKGAWETYKLVKTSELAEYTGDISGAMQSDIKERAKDFFYTMSGYNIYGISEKDIRQEVRTTAEKFADSYLQMQIEKIKFMNEETASKYEEYKPLLGRWTIVDTFVEGARDALFGDKNPNDTRWMRKFYYEQIWGQRLNEMLEKDYRGSLERFDTDDWQTLIDNNYYEWLNYDAGLKSPEAQAALNNWNSGQFIIDIGIAAGLTIVAAEAAPAALAFGSAVVDWLFVKGAQTTAAFTNIFNNGNALVTNIGIVMNSGAVEISSAEALFNLQVAAGELSLVASNILAASGGDPSKYLSMLSGGAGGSSSSSYGSESPALNGNPYNPNSVEYRIKPPYKSNPAHDPKSQLYNPKKTPEPADAANVYDSSVRADMGTWYGKNATGQIYRYFSDNAGSVHFSGIIPIEDVPVNILRQLGIKY